MSILTNLSMTVIDCETIACFRKAVNKYRFQGAGVRSRNHTKETRIRTKVVWFASFRVFPFGAISWIVRYSDPDQIAANFRNRTLAQHILARIAWPRRYRFGF